MKDDLGEKLAFIAKIVLCGILATIIGSSWFLIIRLFI